MHTDDVKGSASDATVNRGPVTSRRRFVSSLAAAAATVTIVPRRLLGGPGETPPSEELRIGMIGVGGQGVSDMTEFLKDRRARVIAVCDVRDTCDYSQFYYGGIKGREPARELVEQTYANVPDLRYDGCATYVDFKEMLERPDLDAVSIATPDHVHAVATMAAIQKGKHVYCQKPLTHTVREARAVTKAAAKHGVVTQLGHQLHATDKLKRLVELVQAGVIGPVREIHCWAGAKMGGRQTPSETPPVPKGFDWDRWVGPAPYRPYHPAYAPFTWRHWRDFGTGTLGDFGCHILDPAMWAIGLPEQMAIEATTTGGTDDSYAIGNRVRYRFVPPGQDAAITVVWHDGGLKPFRPDELPADVELPGSGGMYVGDEGTILGPHGGEPRVFLKRKGAIPKPPPQTLPRGESHYEEWVRACRGGPPPLSNFSYAGPLTEMVLLGNVALVTGRPLKWHGGRFEFLNDSDANGRLHRRYRNGWPEMPVVGAEG